MIEECLVGDNGVLIPNDENRSLKNNCIAAFACECVAA